MESLINPRDNPKKKTRTSEVQGGVKVSWMVREKWWGMARGQGPVSRSSTQQHGALAGGTGGTGGTGGCRGKKQTVPSSDSHVTVGKPP